MPRLFTDIQLHGWRQFARVEIGFHPRLTVLTGANGSGKTTILNLLNRHFGWSFIFVSTPRRRRKGQIEYVADSWKRETDAHVVGSIGYPEARAELSVPATVGESYQLNISNQHSISGVFVPSHRPVYVYQRVDQIPTSLSADQQLFDNYLNEIRSRFTLSHTGRSASYRIKEALISLATFGYGNEAVDRDQEAIETFEGFQRILRTVLPRQLGFQRIRIRMPDVVMETETGVFAFDAVSGGISAIIDVSWQIYMASLLYDEFVVLIDEPENHLHPQLQRELLPSFLNAFPQVQFVVATHNPFMVTSVPDSNVYVLSFDAQRRVRSEALDLVNKAGSSNEILRDVLGVDVTLPLWVEARLNALVAEYSEGEISTDRLDRLRGQMDELGLGDLYPSAVDRVLERRQA